MKYNEFENKLNDFLNSCKEAIIGRSMTLNSWYLLNVHRERELICFNLYRILEVEIPQKVSEFLKELFPESGGISLDCKMTTLKDYNKADCSIYLQTEIDSRRYTNSSAYHIKAAKIEICINTEGKNSRITDIIFNVKKEKVIRDSFEKGIYVDHPFTLRYTNRCFRNDDDMLFILNKINDELQHEVTYRYCRYLLPVCQMSYRIYRECISGRNVLSSDFVSLIQKYDSLLTSNKDYAIYNDEGDRLRSELNHLCEKHRIYNAELNVFSDKEYLYKYNIESVPMIAVRYELKDQMRKLKDKREQSDSKPLFYVVMKITNAFTGRTHLIRTKTF